MGLHPRLFDGLACFLSCFGETAVLGVTPANRDASMISSQVLKSVESLVNLLFILARSLLDQIEKLVTLDIDIVLQWVTLLWCIDRPDFLSLVDILCTAQTRLQQSKKL